MSEVQDAAVTSPARKATTTSSSISTPVANREHSYLRNGDLVYISDIGISRAKRLKDRQRQLGRIVVESSSSSMPSPDKSGVPPDEVRYTVEWVLGGKLTGIKRDELRYTTAQEEGMTDSHYGGGSRRAGRTKRKPPDFMAETAQRDAERKKQRSSSGAANSNTSSSSSKAVKAETKPAKNKELVKKKKEPIKKKPPPPAAAPKKKPAAKTKAVVKAKPTKAKVVKKKAPTTASKKTAATGKKEPKRKTKKEENQTPAQTPGQNVLELYDKHRREFERIVTRLEKVDKFGYFFDEAPPEFDETRPLLPQASLLNSAQKGEEEEEESTLSPAATQMAFSGALIEEDKAVVPLTTSSTFAAKEVHVSLPSNKNHAVQEASSTMTCSSDALPPCSQAGPVAPPAVTSSPQTADQDNTTGTTTCPSTGTSTAEPTVVFPAHPPFNWKMVRRRMELGRYMLDREKAEEDERFRVLDPYYRTLGKKRPRRKFAVGVNNQGTNKKKQKKKASVNPRIINPQGVDWDQFQEDVVGMCDAAIARDDDDPEARDSLTFAAKKVKEAVLEACSRTGSRQKAEMKAADDRHKFATAIEKHRNTEAAMQSWRKNPFPERKYERLSADTVCDGLSDVDKRIATYERKTSLPDSFVGISYRYDDTGQSEAWMKSVVDETGNNTQEKDDARKAAMALAADDGVTRAQVVATMQTLLIGVQDRVMTERNVLHQHEVRSVNWHASPNEEQKKIDFELQAQSTEPVAAEDVPEIVEQAVWGIDCYTRRNITLCLQVEFDPDTCILFIEKWLLPAINACPVEFAPDMGNAARLLEGLPFTSSMQNESATIAEEREGREVSNWSQTRLGLALREKIKTSSPPWLKAAANELRRARETLGPNFFRIHPKGHGSVLLSPKVEANRLVTFYRGELYPSWRWGEKMDAITLTQERKNLKPALPDFYNMALERPQIDPRGYGLLFVDASRKAGHGSSLSHSCEPTCEVRVAALNGELCLAMTTLRELEMGEELAFNYNAVTESLNEYSSAVCLCGHNKCRGSFLHFATADCYQQVLNRNAPIATRFSNLIKGSMKQVMSEDDDRILGNHGFRTAAFGAISVNRREGSESGEHHFLTDSLENVPVWLRTYAADVLRYIEYERRALPISLICDHLSTVKRKKVVKESLQKVETLKEPGREPAFFHFSRVEHDFLRGILRKEGFPETANGLELKHAMQKVASGYWQSLTEQKKQYWKDRAEADYQKKRKAWLAQQRKQQQESKSSKGKNDSTNKLEICDVLETSKISFEDADAEGVAAMEQRIQQLTQTLSRVGRVLDRHREKLLESMKTDVDENAIIDTNTLRSLAHVPLSVLDDDRVVGWMWNSYDGIIQTLLRQVKNSPCVRPVLYHKLSTIAQKYSFLERFGDPTRDNGEAKSPNPNGMEGRRELKDALLKMRKTLLEELKDMGRDFRRFRIQLKNKTELETGDPGNEETGSEGEPEKKTEDPTAESDSEEKPEYQKDVSAGRTETPCLSEATSRETRIDCTDNTSVIRSVIDGLVDRVVRRGAGEETDDFVFGDTKTATNPQKKIAEEKRVLSLESDPWLEHYNQRFVLDVAADVLLFYAQTKNFFVMNPYHVLESTPLDVYARELGNAVPRSAVDDGVTSFESGFGSDSIQDEHHVPVKTSAKHAKQSEKMDSTDKRTKVDDRKTGPLEAMLKNTDEERGDPSEEFGKFKVEAASICEPDDIVATVSVRYQGDYVLSQLLQWYNGGIGQQSGLPDVLGCILLPSLQSCWASCLVDKSRQRKPEKKTIYETKTRAQLVQWLQDPYQRGNPWPDEVRQAFERKEDSLLQHEDASTRFLAFGSPIIDFLATGDESTIHDVLEELDADDKVASKKNDGLLSSLDKGRPAQAVSNWVQCENPDCLKWRKIPWHVDIDLLPEKFFCKDNKWNPAASSCDVPEDEWDHDDSLVDRNGKVEGSPVRRKIKGSLSPLDEKNFVKGARFDVRRQGKDKYCTGIVVLVDFSGKVKRILFHFPKVSSKYDEWIEFGSDRIARLNTLAVPKEPKRKEKNGKKEKDKKKKDGKEKKKGPSDTVNDADNRKPNLKRKKAEKMDSKQKKRRKSTSHKNGTLPAVKGTLTEAAEKSYDMNMAAGSDFSQVAQIGGVGSQHISDINVAEAPAVAAIEEPPLLGRTNASDHGQAQESIQQSITNGVRTVEVALMNNASNGRDFASFVDDERNQASFMQQTYTQPHFSSATNDNYQGNQAHYSHVTTGGYNGYIGMQQQQQQMNWSTFGVQQYRSSLYPLSQNNNLSMRLNCSQVVNTPITQTMSAESAAYELLLLSSAARERSNYANSPSNAGTGLSAGIVSSNTTNTTQQLGGPRMFTTGQPNADGSFTPLQQQGIFDQTAQQNPMSSNSNNLTFFLNTGKQSGFGPNRFNM